MKKLTKLTITTISLMTLLFTGCNSDKTSDLATPAKGSELDGPGFTVTVPDTWTVRYPEPNVYLCSSESYGDEDIFEQVIIFEPAKLSKDMSLDEYIDTTLEHNKNAYSLDFDKDTTIDGHDGKVYVGKSKRQTNVMLKYVFFTANDKVYIAQYSGDNSDGYDAMESEADSIIASIKPE